MHSNPSKRTLAPLLLVALTASSGCGPGDRPIPDAGTDAAPDAPASDSAPDIIDVTATDTADSGTVDVTDLDGGLDADLDAEVDAAPDAVDAIDEDAVPAGPGLRGVLHNEAGDPLAGTMVLACTTVTCFVSQSAADGSFYFMLTPPVNIALKTLENSSMTPRRGEMLYPVQLTDATLVDVGAVYAPTMPTGATIGPAFRDPQTLAAGDGVEMTLNRADLTAPLGATLDDLAARSIPPERQPQYTALAGEQVVAVFALHPFAVTSSSPIAVRVTSSLPAGTAVNFRTVSDLDGHLSAPIPGHADGTVMATDPSTGITQLTWLVISR